MNTNKMKHQIISELSREMKALRADMRVRCITSAPFVVEVGGLYVNPVIRDRKTTKDVTATTSPLKAMRFCNEDAATIAHAVQNGAGEHGRVISIYQAVRERYVQIRRILRQLRQLPVCGV